MTQSVHEQRRCRDWLMPHMAGNKPKIQTKEQYWRMASASLGKISKSAFDAGWFWAINDSGRKDWLDRSPQIKSHRQHIRLWFEFYKLAFDDPALQDNLAKVRTFYEPWGDPRGLDFRDWWKDHGYLFGETQVEEIAKISKAPNVLNISIPLNVPASKALADIKVLIESRQRERMAELGLDPNSSKSLKAGFGTYEINAKELRGRPLHEAHVAYRMWLEMGKPTINSAFLQGVRDRLQNRPRAKWMPSYLLREAEMDRKGNPRFAEEQIRQMRRSIKKADDVCVAVSKGRFPE